MNDKFQKLRLIRIVMYCLMAVVFVLVVYGKQVDLERWSHIFNVILFLAAIYFLLYFASSVLSGEFIVRGSIIRKEDNQSMFYLMTGIVFGLFSFFSIYLIVRLVSLFSLS